MKGMSCSAIPSHILLMLPALAVSHAMLQPQAGWEQTCDAGTEALLRSIMLQSNITLMPASECILQISSSLTVTGFHGKQLFTLGTTGQQQPCARGMLVLQQLPPGIYADPYELDSWSQSADNKARDVGVQFHGQVDLESIDDQAMSQAVSLTLPLGIGTCTDGALGHVHQDRAARGAGYSVSVPLHSRYVQAVPKPDSSSWWGGMLMSHTLHAPWAACYIVGATNSRNMDVSDVFVGTENAALQWTMPVGSLWHAPVVAALTVGSTALGALGVLWQLWARQIQ